MRKSPILIISTLALTFLASCAKEETPSTTSTVTSPTAVDRPAEVVPPPAATETVMAESTGTEPTGTEPTAPSSQEAANTPPPLLPRLGQAPPAAPATPPSEPQSNRIMVADAYEIMRAGNGVLVDVRNEDAWQYQRIPGAMNIPLNEVAARAGELPQDKWIITYCTCPAEETSGAAATTLTNMGFERVAALVGGLQAWRGAKLPIEFGQ